MAQLIFGAAAWATETGAFHTPADVTSVLTLLHSHNVTALDTARSYTNSESLLGQLPQRTLFTISTKVTCGFAPGSATRAGVLASARESQSAAATPQFDILYLHAPDASIPLSDTLAGINDAFEAGMFRRFGLSNYSAQGVQDVWDHCVANNYPRPEVYQGNYSAVARRAEAELLPTLRRLGIAFHAYSPLAGGFFTKTLRDLDQGVGRFNEKQVHGMYRYMFNRPKLRAALERWGEIAEREGVGKAELAFRWIVYHSALQAERGDAVVFAGSSLKQIEKTLEGVQRGKLSEEAVSMIQGVWENVEVEAPKDIYHDWQLREAKGAVW